MEAEILKLIKSVPEKDRSSVHLNIQSKLKNPTIAFILDLFLGFFGAHHFYLGRVAWGVIYFLTIGLLGIGALVDLFLVWGYTRKANKELALKFLKDYKTLYSSEDEVSSTSGEINSASGKIQDFQTDGSRNAKHPIHLYAGIGFAVFGFIFWESVQYSVRGVGIIVGYGMPEPKFIIGYPIVVLAFSLIGILVGLGFMKLIRKGK